MFKRVLALALSAGAVVALSACGSSRPSAGATTTAPASPSSSASAVCTYTPSGPAAKPAKLPGGTPSTANGAVVTLTTNHGSVAIALDPAKTPCTVNSFVSLAKQGYFNQTRCHRLTTSGIFVLQCGDPSGTGTGGPGYSFNDELLTNDSRIRCDASGNCIYPAGTVAMANSGVDTNGSQFFLVYKDSPLAYNYTVFGRMSPAGLKVVQQIASHGSGAPDSLGNTPPNESVTIEKATVAR